MALPAAIALAIRGGQVALRTLINHKKTVFFWALRHWYYSVSDRSDKERLLVAGLDTYFSSVGFTPWAIFIGTALIDARDEHVRSMIERIDNIDLERALRDSAQVIINSTRAGFLRGVGPDGRNWPENPEWYQVMKGTTRVLYGPTSSSVHGGSWANNWEFAEVNDRRMIDSMTVSVSGRSAVVSFEPEVIDRAELNEEGGESTMMLRSTAGRPNMEIDINVRARPILGIAVDFARLGSRTDDEHIISIWSDLWDDAIEV